MLARRSGRSTAASSPARRAAFGLRELRRRALRSAVDLSGHGSAKHLENAEHNAADTDQERPPDELHGGEPINSDPQVVGCASVDSLP